MGRDIENELRKAFEQLKRTKEREEFLKIRIDKYKKVLLNYEKKEEQQQQQKQRQENNDNNTTFDEKQREQKIQLKENLVKVITVHIDILRNIKKLEKQIETLKGKKEEFRTMKRECHDFLVAAAASTTGIENNTMNLPIPEIINRRIRRRSSQLRAATAKATAITI